MERFKKIASLEGSRRIIQYKNDVTIRVKTSLYISSAINLAFALMQFYLGITNSSLWFYALAAFYALLTAMRLLLLRHARKNQPREALRAEYTRYRLCGILLAVLNVALVVVVYFIVRQNRGFEHGRLVTVATAAYTFIMPIFSIVGIIRYRKYESPVMSASKIVSLAAASVSVLSFETALMTTFEESISPQLRRIFTASTGSFVCISVLVISAYMIIHSTRELRKL